MYLFLNIIIQLVNIYTFIIFIYCLLSWIPMGTGIVEDIRRVLGRICDPYLNLFRRFIPPIGGMIDVSPIVALLVLQFGVRLLLWIF